LPRQKVGSTAWRALYIHWDRPACEPHHVSHTHTPWSESIPKMMKLIKRGHCTPANQLARDQAVELEVRFGSGGPGAFRHVGSIVPNMKKRRRARPDASSLGIKHGATRLGRGRVTRAATPRLNRGTLPLVPGLVGAVSHKLKPRHYCYLGVQ
jgi:hypothetical protein